MPVLNSQAIERAEYDTASRSMLLVFRSGGAYIYSAVPPYVYRELLAHRSPGWFFRNHVRGRFREARTEWDAALADCAA